MVHSTSHHGDSSHCLMIKIHSTSWWQFTVHHDDGSSYIIVTVQSISWWQFTIHYGDSSEYTIWMAHSTSWWWVILHPSHSSQYTMAWACLHQPVNSVAFRILWGTHTLFLLVNKDILAQPNYNDRQLKSTNFVIRIRNKLWRFSSPEIISDCLFLLQIFPYCWNFPSLRMHFLLESTYVFCLKMNGKTAHKLVDWQMIAFIYSAILHSWAHSLNFCCKWF